ncbi:MAG: M50 family metallopeptidase [Candidatus Caenarcaniphilales bacterium]|nr:M50 family metallopeptidase [Candidatus Caenarcaniphilales bacterium]
MEHGARNPQEIKMRSDLEFEEMPDGTLQVRDPSSIRYFQLGFNEAEIVRMLASMSPLAILERTSYTESQLKKFLGMLKQWGLLEGTVPPPQKSTKRQSILQKIFSRFKLLEPDDFLTWMEAKLDFIWGWPTMTVVFIIFVAATLQGFQRGESFLTYGWPLIAQSWLISLLVFLLLLFIVIVGHELAHGLVLKRYGGYVPEIGFFFVYATPALYTDISDAYKLPKKSQKINVMLAGPMFQAVLGSILYLLWCLAVPHSFVGDLLYLSVIAAFFSLTINLNPLIKLDGYYILQIALDIYDLRRRAWAYLHAVIFNKPLEEQPSPRERKVFLLYAPLSVIYTAFIMFVVISFYFGEAFKQYPALTVLGVLLALISSQIYMPSVGDSQLTSTASTPKLQPAQ